MSYQFRYEFRGETKMSTVKLQKEDFTAYAHELHIWDGILEDNNLPEDTETVTLTISVAKGDE